MWASIVGAPPAGSFVMAKTTFSPFWATGRGAKGLRGAPPLQKRPPQARACPRSATTPKPTAAVSRHRDTSLPVRDDFQVLRDARMELSLIRIADVSAGRP